jgi:hypothetical protein
VGRGLTGRPGLIGLRSYFLLHGLVQPGAYFGGKFHRFRVAKNLDGFLGLVNDHRAILAMLKMALKRHLQDTIEVAVKVIGQLPYNAFAVQFDPPLRKYRFNF